MDSRLESPRTQGRPARGHRDARRLLERGALVALLSLPACATAEPSGSSRERPFEVSLVETRACPLPPTLDAKTTHVVGVKVRVTSRHPGNVPANYFYGSVLTKDDRRWLATLPGCTPVLSSRPLEPGESSEGFLNFAVPKDTRLDRVAYAPRLAGSVGSEPLDRSDLIAEVPLP